MGALDRHARPTVSCETALLWLSAARSHVSVSSGCISLSIPSGASQHALSSNLALPLRLPLRPPLLPTAASAGRGGPWFDLSVWPTWLSSRTSAKTALSIHMAVKTSRGGLGAPDWLLQYIANRPLTNRIVPSALLGTCDSEQSFLLDPTQTLDPVALHSHPSPSQNFRERDAWRTRSEIIFCPLPNHVESQQASTAVSFQPRSCDSPSLAAYHLFLVPLLNTGHSFVSRCRSSSVRAMSPPRPRDP